MCLKLSYKAAVKDQGNVLLSWKGPGKRQAYVRQHKHAAHTPAQGTSLTASVGDGDRHTLDLDTVDVDGLHGLGRRCQLCCVQADDAPSRSNLWQGSLFPENCS